MNIIEREIDYRRSNLKRRLEALEETKKCNLSVKKDIDESLLHIHPNTKKAKDLMKIEKYFADSLPKIEKQIINLRGSLRDLNIEKKKIIDRKLEEEKLKIEELELGTKEEIDAIKDLLKVLENEREHLEIDKKKIIDGRLKEGKLKIEELKLRTKDDIDATKDLLKALETERERLDDFI